LGLELGVDSQVNKLAGVARGAILRLDLQWEESSESPSEMLISKIN
jgi:hypothetical protein